MKIHFLTLFVLANVLCSITNAADLTLKKIDSYEQKENDALIEGVLPATVVDADGALIGAYGNRTILVVDSHGSKEFAPFGQGPGDLYGCKTVLFMDTNLLSVEDGRSKLKLFSKEMGSYVFKEAIWKEKLKYPFSEKGGLRWKDKLFFTGYAIDPKSKIEQKEYTVYYMASYTDKGKFRKYFANDIEVKANSHRYKYSYIWKHKENIYFIREDKLEVFVVSPQQEKVIDKITLPKPTFYKPLPAHFLGTMG